MDAQTKDRNWQVLQNCLNSQIPLAVTRMTTLTTAAADIVTLNESTEMIRIYSKTYDTYIYFYGTGRTATVSATVFHKVIPAWVPTLISVPPATTKITGIANESTVPLLIVEEY